MAGSSGRFQSPVIVAVLAVGMVQMSFYQVVRVVAVRHRFMPAVGSMDVVGGVRSALVIRRAMVLIGAGCFKRMFVYMVAVDMVQMSVVKVIHVAIVLDGSVAAIRTMDMGMFFLFHAGSRHRFPFVARSNSGSGSGTGESGT
jgi:hypothetical protein